MRLSCLLLCIPLLLGAATVVHAATDSLGGGRARPAPETGRTPVEIGFFILDLSRVDDVLQEFVIDFRLEVRWYDSRVVSVEEAPARTGEVLPLEEVWHPSLTILNQRRIWPRFPEQVVIQSDGSLAYGQRYYGTFAAPLDLRKFPLDEQVVRIVTGSKRYAVDELEILPFDRLMGSLGESTLPNWKVGEGRFESTTIGIPSFGKQFAAAIYSIPLKRGSGYFIWKVVLPLFLIVSMIFVFLALAEAITSTRLARGDHFRFALGLDRACRIVFPVSFCAIVSFIFLF